MKNLKKLLADKYLLFLLFLSFVFFYPFILFGKIPIPADTIVGMYHPWRDVVWNGFTAGVAYKNPLITDPVRQQYVWRALAVGQMGKGQLPLWNPYSFSGTPLLANFQTAAFYPLNILLFLIPFPIAWGILVMLQPLLAGLFLYLYLQQFRINKFASFVGAIAFSYSGFSIAWLEWNTIIHTLMWLPLILLIKEKLLEKFTLKNGLFLIIVESTSIFAGHLQVLFYTMIVSNLYLVLRIIQLSIKVRKDDFFPIAIKKYIPYLMTGIIVLTLTSIQWLPTMQFIAQSAREVDQGSWMKEGWFIPWQNLIQYIAPDFFGNPATGNYWGVWNYGEFIGYFGIIPLIFTIYALLFRRDKKTLFFTSIAIGGLLFALPTPIAKLVYQWNIPLLSTSQPTRLLSIISLSLCILAAFGADTWIKEKNKKRILASFLVIIFGLLAGWLFILFPNIFSNQIHQENILVSRHNLVLPTILSVLSFCIISMYIFRIRKISTAIIIYIIIVFIITDLFRFGWKFTPFSDKEWLYPSTKITQILSNDLEPVRILTLDRRIMAPNFSGAYYLQDVSGYDPLYLGSYNQFVAAWERGKPDISPAAFNRIITPTNVDSSFADLLGVKYVLNLGPIESKKLRFLYQEGQTYLYENTKRFPRAFFVENIIHTINDQDEIEKLYAFKDELRTLATTQQDIQIMSVPIDTTDSVDIALYEPNKIDLKVSAKTERLLVLVDPYYPTWRAYVDGKESRIYKVDYMFRGVVVPTGNHIVKFSNNLL